MSKYNLTYHLARGVTVTVDNVSESDVDALKKALENLHAVINVGDRKSDRIQLVPARNILAIDAVPVEAKDGE